MGVLSDLVVAPEGDAEKIAGTDVPSEAYGGIDIKGIDIVKFGTLHALVSGRAYKDVIGEDMEAVFSAGEEGPWVFQISDELVRGLAALPDAKRDGIAKKWAATEEFKLDSWEEDAVAETLGEIAKLAKKAVKKKQALFLWTSL